ncbi:MAG: signal recognition particle protein [Flavobacteriales bacterium]|nr:signal recognition particle protein [Flavobacteriales bacterium]MBH69785.1 signal recognition particle protein [Flavobacteriales bacterium]|tara:strand:+ start:2337 stop:3680 length:1344 start_codon:yes stop_codon:yes gene_type:complete
MFENLSEKLERAFKVLKGSGSISEINVAQTMKEIRKALLSADVDYKTAKQFTSKVKEKAIGQKVLTSVEPGQLLTKIMKDELTELMGSDSSEINLKSHNNVILVAGLQGSGKTTFSGKLALYLKSKKNFRPLLVACDVYRPAAIDQLEVLSKQVNVDVFTDRESKDPIEIAKKSIKFANENNNNVTIIDTAGRLAIDDQMMQEIEKIKNEVNPNETLFVVDSMTGQDAVNTAKTFNDRLDYDGVVLTKLDGDTRGGAALTIRSVVNKPIKFIGTSEKMDGLDAFHPDRMASRILGMGDVISLVERAQQQYDEEEARKVQKKIAKNQFGFDDFLKQIQQIKKMGNIKDLMGMIPGMGKAIKGMDIDDDAFKGIEAIINSMTKEERKNPKILNGSRRKRIADGSGKEVSEVNQLVKQFSQMGKMMKMMQGGGAKQMMEMMKNRGGFPKM